MPGEGKLIYGGWLVPAWGDNARDSFIEGGALYEEDGRILAVGTYAALRQQYPDAPSVGDPNYIVVPGFVNAHSHGRGFSTYQMGQPDEPLEMRIVEMAFRTEWGAADSPSGAPANRGYDPYLDTLYSCLKQIASGITTTVHSHIYLDGPVEPYGDMTREVLRAYRDSGIRCAFALGVRDRNTFTFMDDQEFLSGLPPEVRNSSELRPMICDMGFSDYYALLRTLAQEYPEIAFQLHPLNPVWCSDGLLEDLAAASDRDGWRIHTHLMETPYQAAYGRESLGKSWVAHLKDIGMLSERFSGAHGVWMDRDDIETMRETGAQIVHNPSSNLRLSSGVAPLRDFLGAGVTVGLGLDSLSMNDDEDMFQDLRLAQQVQNRPGIDGLTIPARTMFEIATRGGATVSGFDGIGSLDVGNRADVVLLPWPEIEGGVANQPMEDVVLRRAKATHVKTVIVGGKILIQDGRWVNWDPDAILADLSASVGPGTRRSLSTVEAVKESVRAHLRTLV